jgi:hypothetical protein
VNPPEGRDPGRVQPRRPEHETARSLSRSMPFPDRWDPFLAPLMSVIDVYAYPTLHFDFHARQLSLGGRARLEDEVSRR